MHKVEETENPPKWPAMQLRIDKKQQLNEEQHQQQQQRPRNANNNNNKKIIIKSRIGQIQASNPLSDDHDPIPDQGQNDE
ncbi:MAG: hypothetical protein M1816_004472 [Peltula sp. TS41687]|nr:MAG: hypothetical protein M1816_004472 [Peltula sp. TS41687]